MAFKFFNIGKANAEIDRLETQVAELTRENSTLRENAPEIEAAAETLRGDLQKAVARAEKAEGEAAAAATRLSEVTAAKDKAEAEAKTSAEKLANPSEIIKTTASAQAAAIVASVGHSPLALAPSTMDPKKMTRSEFAKMSPREQSAFAQNGGRITD